MIEGTTMTKPQPPADDQGFLTAKQAATRLGISEDTLRRMVKDERIKAAQFGPRLLRIHKDDLEAFIRAALTPSPPPTPDEAVSALTTYRAAVDSLPAALPKKDGDPT